MPTKHPASSISQSSPTKETADIIILPEGIRQLIKEERIDAVREEFNQPESTTDQQIV